MQAAAFADGGVLATFSPAGALIALRILCGLFSVFPFKIKKALLHLVRLSRDDRIRPPVGHVVCPPCRRLHSLTVASLPPFRLPARSLRFESCAVFFLYFPFKIKKALLYLVRLNRDDRIRTCDILVPNQARYQLRYIP